MQLNQILNIILILHCDIMWSSISPNKCQVQLQKPGKSYLKSCVVHQGFLGNILVFHTVELFDRNLADVWFFFNPKIKSELWVHDWAYMFTCIIKVRFIQTNSLFCILVYYGIDWSSDSFDSLLYVENCHFLTLIFYII